MLAFLTIFELSLMPVTFAKTVACFPLWEAAVPEFPEVTCRGVKLARGFALPPGLVIPVMGYASLEEFPLRAVQTGD